MTRAAATVLFAVGVFLLVAWRDLFVAFAVLPLVIVLLIIGRQTQVTGAVPARWRYWLAAAVVAGLAIYGLSLWVYDLAHQPVPA